MTKLTEFDPYEELMEIIKFCHSADQHIATLIANQETILKSVNQLREDLTVLERQVFDLQIKDQLDDLDD